jgi:hypothetical protein
MCLDLFATAASTIAIRTAVQKATAMCEDAYRLVSSGKADNRDAAFAHASAAALPAYHLKFTRPSRTSSRV